jgi:DEAD/DEAH box helicase domain-containing protein
MSRNRALALPPSSPDLVALLEEVRQDPKIGRELVHTAYLPPCIEEHGELDPPLPEPIARALGRGGVSRLWTHQTEGIAAVRRGENVLVTTPTASGKSLVFQIPALEEALSGGSGRALFLFPLKALGQDQRGKLARLAEEAGITLEEGLCEIYDGDTPVAKRAAIRKNFPRVVISNPDMLHMGILSNWTTWGPFLADLKWIVLDELHTYRGIFGSHFHHVLQRLLRLCRSVGGDPVLIASSATAANAAEFAETLTGRRFRWIAESGAPREGRHFLLFRPEASPYTSALRLFVRFLQAGLKTIVFTKARRITELLYSWLRREEPALAARVASYRAGFLAEERRRIEKALFDGKLDGVISTSALEMGIDVGGLDACILVGYPGSMMATWQRSGRVGRDGKESITALMALPDALDQYFLDHPEHFLERPCERLIVDPTNDPISRAHLVCAAAEMPLSPAEESPDLPYLEPHRERVEALLKVGHLLEAVDTGELFSLRRRPQREVTLRGAGNPYTIHDEGRNGAIIGTVDGVRVLHECHPGAVYLHAGRQYLVSAMESEERRVRAAVADLDYYTSPLTEKETEILEVLQERTDGPLHAWLGRLKVTERVIGYERKRIFGQETIDQHPLDLPPVEFETVGLWWAAPRPLEETIRQAGELFMGSLHASEHAAISLFPILALCDRGDIGGISYSFQPQVGSGAVFIYDGYPGGVGIAARGYQDLPDLLRRVLTLVEACPCEVGCPSCIQSPKCGNGNRPLDKAGAARSLRLLLGDEAPAVPWAELPPLQLAAGGIAQQTRGSKLVERTQQSGPGGTRGSFSLPVSRSLHPSSHVPPPGEGEGWSRGEDRRGAGRIQEGAAGAEAAAPLLSSPLSQPPPPRGEEPYASPTVVGDSDPATPALTLDPAVPADHDEALEGWEDLLLPRGISARMRPSAPPARTVLFDLETLRSAADVGGWQNAHRMGVAIGVACFLEEGRFEVYREHQVRALVEELRRATTVVGFNILRFDYKVLAGYTGEDHGRNLPTLDLLDWIFQRLGFRIGMGHLALETLGFPKSADGLQSLAWVREGRFDLIEQYCRKDVEILRDLYLHGRREGCLFYRDKKRDVRLKFCVDW